MHMHNMASNKVLWSDSSIHKAFLSQIDWHVMHLCYLQN